MSAPTAAGFALRIRPSRDLPSETSSTLHPRRTSNKTEPLRPTSSPNYTSKCSIAFHAEFTVELSRSDPTLIEKADFLPRGSREMPQEKPSTPTLPSDFESYLI